MAVTQHSSNMLYVGNGSDVIQRFASSLTTSAALFMSFSFLAAKHPIFIDIWSFFITPFYGFLLCVSGCWRVWGVPQGSDNTNDTKQQT